MAQLPPHIILPNDSYLPLDLSCGDPGQPSSLSYGDNTAAHDGPSYDLGDYCPFDSDSTTCHESTASSASTRDCQVLFSDLPTEYIRNHRSEQGDEIQELLEAFGNGLHISPTASLDDLRQDFDTLSSDEVVSEPGHRSLDTSHEEQTVPSLERYLAREWTEHPSCSRQSHKEDHEELAKNKCHRSCDSLNDVVARLDGLIGDENNRHPLPNVMDPSFDLLSHTQHTETANNEGTSRNSPPLNNYIPKNLNIAQTNSRARQEGISTERLSDMNAEFGILGQGSRSTSLSYVLQNRHLEAIWEGVRTRAATYPQFAGIKLYLGAKNLKLVYMNTDIRQTIRAWRSQWQNAVDRAFLDSSDTYVDIGRQYTPRIGSVAEANVLMWRRCCLKQLWRQRQAWSSQSNAMYPFVRSSFEDIATSKSRSVPLRLIEYPRFTLRDTIDMTIQPADESREVCEGLIYSQFYNLVKIPFDAAKQYPFQNRQLEKMALDPSDFRYSQASPAKSTQKRAAIERAPHSLEPHAHPAGKSGNPPSLQDSDC
ncbi:hypothetical protein Forpi1262_v009393 [Fusarium oxysporum f. sp. raphani]|uniref:Uncharacterized protein n=1 Tax=Fusarium oxysporum f. sp. raphani TaxID=96318 RepID=A0A8J5UL29_FUSOX|nr:hypothetical protein Forpi1262_v009393 [Fusarium oxysporum f. sp. raphani]